MDRVASEGMSIIWLLFLIPSISLSTTPSSRPMASIRSLIKAFVTTDTCRLSAMASSSYTAISVLITSSARLGTELFIEMVTIDACLLATSLFTVAR